MASDKLITDELIRRVKAELYPQDFSDALKWLQAAEPDLAGAITRAGKNAAEQLVIDTDSTVSNTAYLNVIEAVQWAGLIAAEVSRRAFYALWRESIIGTRLAQIDPTLDVRSESPSAPPDKAKRTKRGGNRK